MGTLTILGDDHQESVLFAVDRHHRDEGLRCESMPFEQFHLERQLFGRVATIDVDVGLGACLGRIVVEDLGKVEVLFRRALIDDFERLIVVRVVGRRAVDDSTVARERRRGERHRRKEFTTHHDAHRSAGRGRGGGGGGGGGSKGCCGTYWCKGVRSGRREGILDVLRHGHGGKRSRRDLRGKDKSSTTTVYTETLDTAIGMHLDHDVSERSRIAFGESEKVATTGSKLGTRKQGHPLSIGRGHRGGIVNGAENLGGFGEVA